MPNSKVYTSPKLSKNTATRPPGRLSRRTVWVSLGMAILVAIVVVACVIGRRTDQPKFASDNVSSAPAQHTTTNTADDKANNGTVPPASGDKQDPAAAPAVKPGDTQVAIVEPSGTFVSNHRPQLSGSPAQSNLQSVCKTTATASCDIAFTKDGVTKSLGKKTTDDTGTATWYWSLRDLGLTEGSWQITAIAGSGNQTKTTKDTLNLEVMP